MREGKQSVIEVVVCHQNPVAKLVTRYNEFERIVKNWLEKQCLPAEVAIVTVASGIEGAAIGGFLGRRSVPAPPGTSSNPHAVVSIPRSKMQYSGGALVQARNFAVMSGVNAGVCCVMRRLRGKEDLQTTMVAAFSSGVMFSLVSGMGSPIQAVNVICSGVLFALVQCGIYKVSRLLPHSP